MTGTLSNEQIIEQLECAAAVIEVTDTSPQKVFRVRAYQTAIDSLSDLDEQISFLVAQGQIETLPGIGKELNQKITDLVTKGSSASLDKLYRLVPAGMFPLLSVPGLGPKRAYQLANHLNLNDPNSAVEKLKEHVDAGKIAALENFGQRSQAKLKQALESFKPKSTRMLINSAQALAHTVINELKQIPKVIDCCALGSLRRCRDTIGDVDLGVVTLDVTSIVDRLKQGHGYQVTAAGDNIIRLVYPGNKQVDIKFATPKTWGATLQHFTGSKAHNIALREYALKQGRSLSEHGIKVDNTLHTFKQEADFYRFLGLPYIDPRLREDGGEIIAAQKGALPVLVDPADIHGDTHTHTNFQMVSSHDSGMPLIDLFDKCQALGYDWVVVGDHNPSQQSYSPKDMVKIIAQRRTYIEQEYYSWKEKHENSRLNILISMEIDILPDGTLAIPDQALESLDLAMVSIHSRFDLNEDLQTKRLLRSLTHPKVKVVGHPTGRLLGYRSPISVSWNDIFTYCHQHHITLEINGHPRRLDLPDSLVKQAIGSGVKISLGTDAHHPNSLENMAYAVDVAARGWCQKHDMINTYSFDQLKKWLQKRR